MITATDSPPLDPACACGVAALGDEPFYGQMLAHLGRGSSDYRAVLARYFDFAIREGERLGRVARAADPRDGIAIWTLPQAADVQAAAVRAKREFLERHCGTAARVNYDLLVETMADHAADLVPSGAWYLSILAVQPALQGKGLGQALVGVTLAEADAKGADTYVETSNPRNLRFYQRLGYTAVTSYREPVTTAEYWVLVRRAPRPNGTAR
jgi:ribosomal protein S18 acetylase RimI-like enzyme